MLLPDSQLKQLVAQKGLVNEKVLEEVSELAKNSSISFGEALVEKEIISDENLGKLTAEFLKYPFVTLGKISIPDEIVHIIPERFAKKQNVIPFGRDKDGIKVAMADPSNNHVLEMIAKKTNENITAYLATEKDIHNTLHIYRKNLQKTFDSLLKEEIGRTNTTDSDEAPISKIVDLLIEYAYEDKASDIHIEPEEKNSVVRFRIDGILHNVLYVPKILNDRIITRIKVLAKLRTDEHMGPQDGKIRIAVDHDNLDLRVSILPVVDGEKAVLRLLASSVEHLSLLDLGMNEKDLKKVTEAYNKPYGMILSTGPTGAGKTTAIYAILKILNTREKNITTIEDPVEYRIKGVNQIQVNTKANLTFANGLRSILRQDPNIIFVGEIRDTETAAIAVNAALTGHLVLSTLHTNDAATALPRLIDMRVEPFLVASTVNVIIAQRLLRRICEMCRTQTSISSEELATHIPPEIITKNFGPENEIKTYIGKGYKLCHYTGYKGRVGIFEVLEVTKDIKKLIIEKQDSDVIARTAINEGMTTMLDDGLKRVSQGITTIEEVLRVIKVEDQYEN